jgi:hypothetical protein
MASASFEIRHTSNYCVWLVPIKAIIQSIGISRFIFIRKIDRFGRPNIIDVTHHIHQLFVSLLPFELQKMWTQLKHRIMLLFDIKMQTVEVAGVVECSHP